MLNTNMVFLMLKIQRQHVNLHKGMTVQITTTISIFIDKNLLMENKIEFKTKYP